MILTKNIHVNRDIDEAEYLLDQLGAPDKDEDKLVTKLRNRLRLFLQEIRQGAEGSGNKD
ncbi:uncharacterized protein B0P05DRAFT_536908 [Gilbertella persicaria]|uniref:uncharacterized protein n=1 Tax=Gilbertella persicaria TaxID=101096 RepID=UPI0022210807|nr:uncharacterized protein B0P05DRAFT_536908 [Gilbertella persicaria]KAI8083320.1 hypothetical protein B0P05DRAFT_536908 [Gilbertella persicaria]